MLKNRESLLWQALTEDDWTLNDHLLALVHDQLAIANWQRSKNGAKNRNRPKPISPLAKQQGTRYGNTTKDPEEVKAFLRRLNPTQYENRG